MKAEIPVRLFHFAPSEFTYPSPSALLAEGLEVCLQMYVSASAGWEKEGKKSIILIKAFWFSLKCRPSTLTLFMELSEINFCVAGGFFQLQVLV